MSAAICQQQSCNNAAKTKDLCSAHYTAAYRKRTTHTYTCDHCQTKYTTGRKPRGSHRFCTQHCQRQWNSIHKREQMAETQRSKAKTRHRKTEQKWKNCDLCGCAMPGKNKYCSDNCRTEARKANQPESVASAAKSHNFPLLVKKLAEKATINDFGCWEWPRVDKKGYPRPARRGGLALHRVVLQEKLKTDITGYHAHHTCGNSKCVNPEHLQLATHAENIAEMLARSSYENRIKALEKELKRLDPHNPLLKSSK